MALTIFLKLGMVVKIDANEKVTKPDYPKKFWIIQKVQKCGQNDSFLTFFSKMALTILMKLAQNVELINSEHPAKTACQNLFPFLR